ncbi:FAD-dependent oxidoreductase [Amycolatopsis sp. NPDC059090]|uniref:oxidoreductase n=1 Tax=unclassified Amycolatopsis TaxID=2618356 RepID=UPI003670A9E1
MLNAVFRRGRIGDLELPNRIIMGSMHLGLEADDDGTALAAFYAERARGGAGLMVTGGWAVNPAGLGGPDYGLIGTDAGLHALDAVTTAVGRAGGAIALQLFHAGRYASPNRYGENAVAPSAVPSRFSAAPPRELTEAEIWSAIDDFAAAAKHARAVGFNAVEIMGAEGYLLNQFTSPLTNHRTDRWGGDSYRRGRFGVEVVRAVRRVLGPGFPIVFRFSADDLMAGSSTWPDTVDYARRFVAAGADALNVSVGWHESRVPTVQSVVPAGVWVRCAVRLKAALGDVPVIASNRINRVELADRILRTGRVDFVSMARAFLADPHLMRKAEAGKANSVNVCIACNQMCIDRSLRGRRVSCLVNPRAAREAEFDGLPDKTVTVARRFAVVGGGPAGCEAALALASFGHDVMLFEAAGELGGQFRLARLVPGKADYGSTVDYFKAELARLGVQVRLGVRVEPRAVAALGVFDGVVLATGSRPRRNPVRNSGHPRVLDYPEAFLSGVAGERIAVIGGGGIALDLAHLLTARPGSGDGHDRFLADHGLRAALPALPCSGPEVSLLTRGPKFGARLGPTTRWALLDTIRRAGVALIADVECERIDPGGVRVSGGALPSRLIAADSIVLAAGQEPENSLAPVLDSCAIPHRIVGGARGTGTSDAASAIEDGLRAAYELAGFRPPAALSPV